MQCYSGHFWSIKGTSQMELYNELGLESLEFRRWLGNSLFF